MEKEKRSKIHVFDLHCDTLDRLALSNGSFQTPFAAKFAEQNAKMGLAPDRLVSLKDNDAHLSLDRMSVFAWSQCFAIFIPDGLSVDTAWILFQHVKSFFDKQLEEHKSLLEQVRDVSKLERVLDAGKCAALLTIEGGSFLEEGQLSRIDTIAEAGVKMLTLTWNAKNAIASGNETSEGLSAFGKEVIQLLEQRRIVVDVSHLNDTGFSDVLKVTKRPCAASHSNSRTVCNHPRNLTDYQFRALAERGGIVGLNLCKQFLSDVHGDPSPDDVLRHVEHWLELGGEKVVALGGDYDGADVPSWLSSGEKLVNLYDHLAGEFGTDLAEALFFNNAKTFFTRNETGVY